MELSRFHSAIEQIASDYKTNGIEADLNALVTNLTSLVHNPGNPQVNQAFKDQLDSFRRKLESSALNAADGDLLNTLNGYGLISYVGDGLFLKIRNVLDENQLTANLAATAIEKLRVETIGKLGIVTAISDAFSKLDIECWSLGDGQTEMLISMPIEQETKTLADLAKETKDWHRICDVISETFDPDRSRVTIRSVASGSVLLYLAAVAPFIFGVAKCLTGVNLILAEMIKMKSLYNQLVDSKAPESVLQALDTHNAGKAKTDLENLAVNLVEEHYKGNDEGRKNELKTSLSIALPLLSQKLAVGAKVMLRLAAPPKPEIADGEQLTDAQKKVLEEIRFFEKVQIEVVSSKAALDYKAHANELMAALPPPINENSEQSLQ